MQRTNIFKLNTTLSKTYSRIHVHVYRNIREILLLKKTTIILTPIDLIYCFNNTKSTGNEYLIKV